MKKRLKTKAWEQYEAGKEYKRKIGLYSTVRSNERFYRGDQWYGSSAEGLPRVCRSLYSIWCDESRIILSAL